MTASTPTPPPGSPPNQVRDFTSVPAQNSTFGTLSIRRKITNTSIAPITRLRFRVVDFNTFPAPSGIADQRPRTSPATNAISTGGITNTVLGTTLEQPPNQPNGGGYNSTLSVTNITLLTPLGPGSSTNIQIVLGIQQTGAVRLQIIPETLPAMPTEMLLLIGDTENTTVIETDGGDQIQDIQTTNGNLVVKNTATPIRNYVLQATSNPLDVNPAWVNAAATNAGIYGALTNTHTGGATGSNRIYRILAVP